MKLAIRVAFNRKHVFLKLSPRLCDFQRIIAEAYLEHSRKRCQLVVFGDVQPLSLLRARCEIISDRLVIIANRDVFVSDEPIASAGSRRFISIY